jgi:hypothetical protein
MICLLDILLVSEVNDIHNHKRKVVVGIVGD